MKNSIIIAVLLSFLSCKKDDDISDIPSNLLEVDITKEFLINEKWFLNTIEVSDECESDNFYVFDQFNEDFVTIQDGEDICDDFSENYKGISYTYETDNSSNRLVIRTTTDKILGGFDNPNNVINGVDFLISKDSSFKLIRGSVPTDNDSSDSMSYELIARADDRP